MRNTKNQTQIIYTLSKYIPSRLELTEKWPKFWIVMLNHFRNECRKYGYGNYRHVSIYCIYLRNTDCKPQNHPTGWPLPQNLPSDRLKLVSSFHDFPISHYSAYSSIFSHFIWSEIVYKFTRSTILHHLLIQYSRPSIFQTSTIRSQVLG